MSAIQTLYQSSKPLIIADAQPNQVNKLEPGQRIQATIQEQVSPGLFKVQVGEQLLQLRLPAQLQVGSKLDLKVESNSPRLTFSFYASSNPISTQEQISATSRFVANMAELPLTRTLIESPPEKPYGKLARRISTQNNWPAHCVRRWPIADYFTSRIRHNGCGANAAPRNC